MHISAIVKRDRPDMPKGHIKELVSSLKIIFKRGFAKLLLFQIIYSTILVYMLTQAYLFIQEGIKEISELSLVDKALSLSDLRIVAMTLFALLFVFTALVIFLQRYGLITISAMVIRGERVSYGRVFKNSLRRFFGVAGLGMIMLTIYAGLFMFAYIILQSFKVYFGAETAEGLFGVSGTVSVTIFIACLIAMAVTSHIYVRTIFAFQVLALEGAGIRESLYRSAHLTMGQYWRGSAFYSLFYITIGLFLISMYFFINLVENLAIKFLAQSLLGDLAQIFTNWAGIFAGFVVFIIFTMIITIVSNTVSTIRYSKQLKIHDKRII